MAKIIKTNYQEQALKSINENLKMVDGLNNILEGTPMNDCKIKISGVRDMQNVSETMALPFTILIPVLKDYRKRMVKEIQEKSKEYNIQLDESEEEIISNRTEKKTSSEDKNNKKTENNDDEKEENHPLNSKNNQNSVINGFNVNDL